MGEMLRARRGEGALSSPALPRPAHLLESPQFLNSTSRPLPPPNPRGQGPKSPVLGLSWFPLMQPQLQGPSESPSITEQKTPSYSQLFWAGKGDKD